MFTTTRSGFVRKLGIMLAGIGMLALAGGTAMAGGRGGGKRYFHKVSAKLERALQAVNATPEQRAAIEQAKQQAFTTIMPIHKQLREKRSAMRLLRDTGNADPSKLAQLQAEQKQLKQQVKGVAQSFLAATNQQLSEPQKKAFADFIAQNGPIFQPFNKRNRHAPAAPAAPTAPAPQAGQAG